MREFLRQKYIEKKWISKTSSQSPKQIDSPKSARDENSDVKRKKDKKDKKAKEKSNLSNDFLCSESPKISKRSFPLTNTPSSTIEEEIHMHFSRGIELLGRFHESDPTSAKAILSTLWDTLKLRITEAGAHDPSMAMPMNLTGKNPFDELPTSLPILLASTPSAIPAKSTGQAHWSPPPLMAPNSPNSINPFDFPL
jgi:hypothetical protein